MSYLLIDSRDRTSSSDTASNFKISLQSQIQGITSVKLKRFIMNHKIYNVSTEYSNSTFLFNEFGTLITFTINNGYYTPDQLAIHIQNGLNATTIISSIYSVSYSSTTYKYTITSTGNFSLPISPLGSFIGFTTAMSTAFVSLSLTGNSVQILTDPSYLYIDISCFGQSLYSSSSQRTTFIVSSMNSDESEYSGLPNQCLYFNTPIDIQSFTIFVKNRDGTQVQLNGTNFAMLLEFNLSD